MENEVGCSAPRVFHSYQFAPGEAEAMVRSIREWAHVAMALREKATLPDLTVEARRSLRRRAAEAAEASEQSLILLLERVQPIFKKQAARSFPDGTPDWSEMRQDAMGEMAAEFARRVPSRNPMDHLFEKRCLAAVKFLALKAVEVVRKDSGRDPRTGKANLPMDSLDARVVHGEGDVQEAHYAIQAGPSTDGFRAAEANDLREILVTGMAQFLQTKDTEKQRAIVYRRIEGFCLRLAGVPYEQISEWLGVDQRTGRTDVGAVSLALTHVVRSFVEDGVDITPEEVITVLRSIGEDVEHRFSEA